MKTIRINIINPKASKLLKGMEELNLITIQNTSKNGFMNVLKKLRSKSQSVPTIDEITKEVEIVRSRRYAK